MRLLLLLLLLTMMTTTTATIRNDFPVACVRSRLLKAQGKSSIATLLELCPCRTWVEPCRTWVQLMLAAWSWLGFDVLPCEVLEVFPCRTWEGCGNSAWQREVQAAPMRLVSIMMSIILLLIMLSIIGQQSLDNARRATLPQFHTSKDRLYVLCSSVERIVITGKVSEEFFRESCVQKALTSSWLSGELSSKGLHFMHRCFC